MPKRALTDAQVLALRKQYREGTLVVAKWVKATGLHAETIRRAARGEGYVSAAAETPPPGEAPVADEAELAASLARLTQAARDMPPLPREVDDMLADMTRKGAADAPRKD